MSEFVSHTNNFAPEIAAFVQENEAFADAVTRRDYFKRLNGDDFISFIQQIASLVRTGDSTTKQSFDGNYTYFGSYHELPDKRDQDKLLRETWDTARSFLVDNLISNEDALEYAGMTIAGGILLVHPFRDGNGRTSRYTSYIVSRGADNIEMLSEISKSSRKWSVMPSLKFVYTDDFQYGGEQPEKIEWIYPWFVDYELGLNLFDTIFDSTNKDRIARTFIEQASPEIKKIMEQYATRNNDGTLASIDGNQFICAVVNDQNHGDKNAEHLKEVIRNVRAELVRNFLRGMRSDERTALKVLDIYFDVDDVEKIKFWESVDAEDYRIRKQIAAEIIGRSAVGGLALIRDQVIASHRTYSEYYIGL